MAESDFDDVVRSIRSRFPRMASGGIRSIIILVVLAIVGFSMFYTIDPEELGVVLRLGKFVRSSEPGLHLKLPVGIERVIKVPVQRQLKEEFGFQTVAAGVRSQFSDRGKDRSYVERNTPVHAFTGKCPPPHVAEIVTHARVL